MLKIALGCFFLFFLILPRAIGQDEDDEKASACDKTTNKKAIKLYQQAMKSGGMETMRLLKEAIEEDPEFVDAYYRLARINIRNGNIKGNMIDYLLKVIELCPTYNVYAYYYLGDIYFGQEQYEEAARYLKEFLKDVDKIKKDEDYKRASRLMEQARFFSNLFGNPVPFNPKIVAGISTPADEVLPIISPDNELAFYTRRYEVQTQKTAWESINKDVIEKFSRSEAITGVFNKGEPMPYPFNQNNNEGGASISIDNKHLFFTICKPDMTGYNNCDIYYSDYINGQWTEIKNLGNKVNGAKTWEAQPTLSGDGKTLYFASIREGNIGFSNENQTSDLYKTVRQNNGEWSAPVNLGPVINTEWNEKSPFIHSDSQTLYFASDGHLGVGGYDIFYVKMNENGEGGGGKNIGYPINTTADELSIFVSTDGKIAYFASNILKGGQGGWDLYSFELYPEARPERVLFLKGEMKDDDGKPVTDARLELKSVSTKEVMGIEVDSTDGKYAAVVTLKKDEDFILKVKKKGVAFSSRYISSKDSSFSRPSTVNMEVKPIEVGKAYTLNNINYATNYAELTEESKKVLDEFIVFLKENPTLKIFIQGHTDNVGEHDYNMALSTDRAFTVREYLQEHHIDSWRLSSAGFGETRPIASNDTEAGRVKNRRTEFVITGK